MQQSSTEELACRSRFALGAASTLLVSTFVFTIPLVACLCDGLMRCYNAPAPKATELVIAGSPWLLQLVAVLGCAVLWIKETKLGAASSLRWNWAAVVVVILFGGFLLLVCVVPIVQIVHHLGYSQL